MDWIKIPIDSLLYTSLSDKEIITIIRYQALYGQLETEPSFPQLSRIFNKKQIQFIEKNKQIVKDLVENQIKSVTKKRNGNKITYDMKQYVSENSDDRKATEGLSESRQNVAADKIRLDKIREEDKEETYLTVGKLNAQLINPELKEVLTEGLKKSLPTVKRETSMNHQKKRQEVFLDIPSWLPKESWESFRSHRVQIKKPMTQESERLTILKLESLKKDGNDPKCVLEQSVMNGWQGIFELKDKQKIKKKTQAEFTREDLEEYKRELHRKCAMV